MSLDAFRGFDMFFIIGGALLLSLSSFFRKMFRHLFRSRRCIRSGTDLLFLKV